MSWMDAPSHTWLDALLTEVAEYETRLRLGPESFRGRSIAITGEKSCPDTNTARPCASSGKPIRNSKPYVDYSKQEETLRRLRASAQLASQRPIIASPTENSDHDYMGRVWQNPELLKMWYAQNNARAVEAMRQAKIRYSENGI